MRYMARDHYDVKDYDKDCHFAFLDKLKDFIYVNLRDYSIALTFV